MILTSLVAAVTFGLVGPQPPLYCPSTLEVVKTPAVTMVYGGATFATCCAGCEAPFEKDPSTLIAKAIKAKKTVGVFQFDPISGLRIEAAKAVAFSDYKAIRYNFASKAEKKTFDTSPAKFIGDIKSEVYHCPIMDEATTFANAASYADYKGVRYFLCCAFCVKKFRLDPAKSAKVATDMIKPLVVVALKK
jgi:YHS domain-containing protein